MKRTVIVSLLAAFALGGAAGWLVRDANGHKPRSELGIPESPLALTIREPGKTPVTLRVVRRGDAIRDSADPDPNLWRVIFTHQGQGEIWFCETAIDPPH